MSYCHSLFFIIPSCLDNFFLFWYYSTEKNTPLMSLNIQAHETIQDLIVFLLKESLVKFHLALVESAMAKSDQRESERIEAVLVAWSTYRVIAHGLFQSSPWILCKGFWHLRNHENSHPVGLAFLVLIESFKANGISNAPITQTWSIPLLLMGLLLHCSDGYYGRL